MDADPTIPCGVGSGPNFRMRVVAGITFAVFVAGLPVAFGVLLWRHGAAMRADQVLRERGEGDTALSNPNFQVWGSVRVPWAGCGLGQRCARHFACGAVSVVSVVSCLSCRVCRVVSVVSVEPVVSAGHNAHNLLTHHTQQGAKLA
jgi:hypothetical protein